MLQFRGSLLYLNDGLMVCLSLVEGLCLPFLEVARRLHYNSNDFVGLFVDKRRSLFALSLNLFLYLGEVLLLVIDAAEFAVMCWL